MLRNGAFLLIVAGCLHWLLYIRDWQGERLKFDLRPMARNNRAFTIRDQVRDNMFWTLAWGLPTWTTHEVLYLWAAGNGHAPLITFSGNPVLFVALIWIILLWKGFHFYWVHRLIHWPPL